jgi:SAM-dependent methyltransferase
MSNATRAIPTRADVQKALAEVDAAFPFPGYISEGARQGLAHIIPTVSALLPAGARRLLDIGSGPMDKTAVWSRLGFHCHAADDLSDPWHRRGDNLQKIVAFARRMDIRFHLQEGDYSLPFPRDAFDVVTIFDVIEHLHESPRGILNAAGGHLKEGGLLAVTMPNSVNLRKRVDVLRGRSNYPPVDQFFLSSPGWRGHVREYTLEETAFICREAGYEVVSATAYEGNAYDKLRGLPLRAYLAMARVAPRLQSALLVVARKPAGWQPAKEDPERFRRVQQASVPGAVVHQLAGGVQMESSLGALHPELLHAYTRYRYETPVALAGRWSMYVNCVRSR